MVEPFCSFPALYQSQLTALGFYCGGGGFAFSSAHDIFILQPGAPYLSHPRHTPRHGRPPEKGFYTHLEERDEAQVFPSGVWALQLLPDDAR